MSYCTVERCAAQTRVRDLQQRLTEAKRERRAELERLQEELEQAMARLVAAGDCGD
jgi:Skp family chaperone for outer membrane proteins